MVCVLQYARHSRWVLRTHCARRRGSHLLLLLLLRSTLFVLRFWCSSTMSPNPGIPAPGHLHRISACIICIICIRVCPCTCSKTSLLVSAVQGLWERHSSLYSSSVPSLSVECVDVDRFVLIWADRLMDSLTARLHPLGISPDGVPYPVRHYSVHNNIYHSNICTFLRMGREERRESHRNVLGDRNQPSIHPPDQVETIGHHDHPRLR